MLYLTYVLGLFPWTRAMSSKLLGYVITPISVVATPSSGICRTCCSFWSLARSSTAAIRLVGLFFQQIGQGRI